MPRIRFAASLVLFFGCQSGRDLPPQPENEPKQAEAPPCGKIFRDSKVRGGSACCAEPAAKILKTADIVAACGASAGGYLGETRDGTACRFHFKGTGPADEKTPASDPKQTYVMVTRLPIPPGAAAPTMPDPMLVWTWKKVALRDALGWKATATGKEAGLLEHQTILWAGRGRRIIGLHASKSVCSEAQAEALLQKAIDATE